MSNYNIAGYREPDTEYRIPLYAPVLGGVPLPLAHTRHAPRLAHSCIRALFVAGRHRHAESPGD
ncbi:MAG: hypothetical protein JW981_10415 [Anaerolineae bacterium]|nr:hypothetical protein [Anaerolineae bacterium]